MTETETLRRVCWAGIGSIGDRLDTLASSCFPSWLFLLYGFALGLLEPVGLLVHPASLACRLSFELALPWSCGFLGLRPGKPPSNLARAYSSSSSAE